MGKARIATKLMGMAYRKVAKIAKRNTKGRKGGKVGGKTPKHKHVGKPYNDANVNVAMRNANTAAASAQVSAGAANSLGKVAFPISVVSRNAIKIGKNAIKQSGNKFHRRYDPFMGKGMPAQRQRQMNVKAHGRPVPGSNPVGFNPMEWALNQRAGKQLNRMQSTAKWQNSSAKKALDSYFRKRR